MKRILRPLLCATALTISLVCSLPVFGAACGVTAPNVTGAQYNSYRTNANQDEKLLNPTTVQSGFGYLFQMAPAAGQMFAQPLILHNFKVLETCYATVVFVATMNNQILAFDGDNATATNPIWTSQPFTTAAASGSVYYPALYCKSNVGFTAAGILSTPLIDDENELMYFVTLNDTQKTTACNATGSTGWVYTLHAISLKGKTFGSDYIPPHDMNPDLQPLGWLAGQQLQRPALAHVGGTILIGFGFGTSSSTGSELTSAYQGWMAGYNSCATGAASCPVTTCLSATNCSFFLSPSIAPGPLAPVGGGVWSSGVAPATDGNFYAFSTGNGCRPDQSTTIKNCPPLTGNVLGDSVIYRPIGVNSNPGSTFTPENSTETPGYENYYVDDYNDLDISTGGVLMIPPTVPKAASSYLIASGKAGQTYVLPTSNLGGYTSTPYQSFLSAASAPPCAVPFPVSPATPIYSGIVPWKTGCAEIHGPAYWNLGDEGFYFVWGFTDVPRGYFFNGSTLDIDDSAPVPPLVGSTARAGGASLAISGNGANRSSALLWAIATDGFQSAGAFQNGSLQAFQLYSKSAGYGFQEVFNSSTVTGQNFTAQRYVVPLVNNGKVYVSTVNGANGSIYVYGPCSQGPNGVCGTQPAN